MGKSIRGVALVRAGNSHKSLKDKLMLAASAGIMTLAAPATGLYGGRAFAQNVTPAACTETDGTQANTIEDGETLVCEGVVLEPINSTVDNLTVVIGTDASTGTVQQDPTTETGISMVGASDQTLTINQGSSVVGILGPFNAPIVMSSANGNVKIENYGTIDAERYAINATVGAGGGNIDISSTTNLNGSVAADNSGNGTIHVNLADVAIANASGPAIDIFAGSDAKAVTVTVGSVSTSADTAINISNAGT